MIYDTVSADTLEIGDNVLINLDHVNVTRLVQEHDSVVLHGVSVDTDNDVTYVLRYDVMVDLWDGLY